MITPSKLIAKVSQLKARLGLPEDMMLTDLHVQRVKQILRVIEQDQFDSIMSQAKSTSVLHSSPSVVHSADCAQIPDVLNSLIEVTAPPRSQQAAGRSATSPFDSYSPGPSNRSPASPSTGLRYSAYDAPSPSSPRARAASCNRMGRPAERETSRRRQPRDRDQFTRAGDFTLFDADADAEGAIEADGERALDADIERVESGLGTPLSLQVSAFRMV